MRQVRRIVSRFWAVTLCVGMLSSIPVIAALGQTEVTEPPGDSKACYCKDDYCLRTGGNEYQRFCCSGETCGCTYFTNC